ncbi:MAG: protease inhibitor I42 family protein [Legionella sp.]
MKTLMGCLLLGFSLMAYANDHMTLNVNVHDPYFVITLPANPTTGFQWSVVRYDENLLTLSNSQYERPNTKLIGAGGQMHLTFRLNKGKTYPASTEIVLKYARSWEPGSATTKNVTVNFVKTTGK